MNKSFSRVLYQALYRILCPLVNILLKNNVPFTVFSDIAKRVYIDKAAENFQIEGRKMTTSRISVLTGLTRHEIARVNQASLIEEAEDHSQLNRASRVIRGWIRDDAFLDETQTPMPLSFDEGNIHFSELVKRYAGDVTVRALLDELLRLKAVIELPDGRYQLQVSALVPDDDVIRKMEIAGIAIKNLLETIDHNLSNGRDAALIQRSLEYQTVTPEALEALRQWTKQHGQLFLERSDEQFSTLIKQHKTEKASGPRYTAGIGLYYFEHLKQPNDE